MGSDTSSRSRRLLTFRLDGDLRQRLKTRLTGEGRTMSEVVILGLQLYVQRSAWLSSPGTPDRDQTPAVTPETPVTEGVHGAGQIPATVDAAVMAGVLAQVEARGRTELPAQAEARGRTELPAQAEVALAGAIVPAGTTVVASAGELVLPDRVAAYLRALRESGHSDLLSAVLAKLHEAGWPLRPLAVALGISRQAVQARIRQPVPAEVRSEVPDVPPPSAFPRRRPALANGRRKHLTVKIDHALRSAAHSKAVREGSSLSQVIEKILDYYLRHGMPAGEIQLGDTTPTRPSRPSRPARRRTRRS